MYSSLLPTEHCFCLTALWIMQNKVLVDTEQDFSIWTKNRLGSNKWIHSLGILEICSYPFMSLRKSFRSHWNYRKSFSWFLLFCIQYCKISVLIRFFSAITTYPYFLPLDVDLTFSKNLKGSQCQILISLYATVWAQPFLSNQRITCLKNINLLFQRDLKTVIF